jgi:hypothetical protein
MPPAAASPPPPAGPAAAVPGPRDPGAGLLPGVAGQETAEPSSQAISAFPAVRTAAEGPAPEDGGKRRRRLLGLALPVWLVAAALCAVGGLGTVMLYPRILPWGETPGESTSDDPLAGAGASSGVGVIGSGSARPGGSAAGNAGSSASPDASASASELPTAPGALRATLSNEQILGGVGGLALLGYRVSITITNPAAQAQQWTNASFRVPAAGLILTPGVGVAATAQDTTICVTPTGPPDSAPRLVPPDGGSVTVQVDVTRVLYTGDPPHSVALADPDCDA